MIVEAKPRDYGEYTIPNDFLPRPEFDVRTCGVEKRHVSRRSSVRRSKMFPRWRRLGIARPPGIDGVVKWMSSKNFHCDRLRRFSGVQSMPTTQSPRGLTLSKNRSDFEGSSMEAETGGKQPNRKWTGPEFRVIARHCHRSASFESSCLGLGHLDARG